MNLSIALSVLAIVAAFGFPWLARRDLLTKLEERDELREEWRRQVISDLEFLKRSATMTDVALLKQALEALINRVEKLAKYTEDLKHLHVDPYTLEVAKLRQTVDQLGKR